MQTSKQPKRTSQKLVEQIRSWLAEGRELPAERQLAQELSVTRHQLRQALEALRLSGELSRPPLQRKLTTVRGDMLVRGTNALEVIELRMMLEPALVRLAAVRATPQDIQRIQKAATTPPGVERGPGDLAFHKQLAEATRNTLAADLYALLRQVGSDSRLHVTSTVPACPSRIRQRDQEHQAIADAIAARDPDRADAAMRAHLASVHYQIVARLTPGMATPPAASPALAT